MAKAPLRFACFGMPFTVGLRPRPLATGRACRAVVAARETKGPARAYSVLRALSFAWFTTTLLLDEARESSKRCPGRASRRRRP